MKKFLVFALLLLLMSSAALVSAQDAQTPENLCAAALPAADPATTEYDAAEDVLEEGVDYRAIFCTGAGAIYIDLFEEYTPVTVNSFVFLAQEGYYNNTMFHRVIADFMAQGGDPTGTGAGGPGYRFEDEFVGFLIFDRPYLLAMANAGPGTNGSQFFITTIETPHLDRRHTIFGEVLSGTENVTNIELRDPQAATTPGTSIDAILIITDPETVDADVVSVEPATKDEFLEGFAILDSQIPDSAFHTITEMATEEVVAAAPAEVQESLEAALTENNHQYSIESILVVCDPVAIPFLTAGYTLHSFATEEDAAAMIANEELLAEIEAANGLTDAAEAGRVPNMVYSGFDTICDMEAVNAATYIQRGHLVARVGVSLRTDNPNTPEEWLEAVIELIYEPILSDQLRREIR